MTPTCVFTVERITAIITCPCSGRRSRVCRWRRCRCARTGPPACRYISSFTQTTGPSLTSRVVSTEPSPQRPRNSLCVMQTARTVKISFCYFISPYHEVLRVSNCDQSMSVVERCTSSVVIFGALQ